MLVETSVHETTQETIKELLESVSEVKGFDKCGEKSQVPQIFEDGPSPISLTESEISAEYSSICPWKAWKFDNFNTNQNENYWCLAENKENCINSKTVIDNSEFFATNHFYKNSTTKKGSFPIYLKAKKCENIQKLSKETEFYTETGRPGRMKINCREVSEDNLYAPKLTRGIGYKKEARCEICYNIEEKIIWLRLKQSSYWYHMNYIHGINSQTGKPFELPKTYRRATFNGASPKYAKSSPEKYYLTAEIQGMCESCKDWVCISASEAENCKTKGRIFKEVHLNSEDIEKQTVDYFNWYKHAQKCQKVFKVCNKRGSY